MTDKTEKSTKKTSSKGNERFMPFLVVLVGVLSFAVGMFWQKVNTLEKGGTGVVAGNNQPTAPQPADGKLTESQVANIPAVNSSDHIKGSADADVVIIEYSDLECPFCGRFHPVAQQVFDEYDGRVAWVYRHFPLDTIHPQARPAAIASECAAKAGGEDAFWAFVDYVFTNQETALADLATTAQSAAGVDISSCVTEGDDSLVEEQYVGGLNAGVTGTPGNFVINKNGEAWALPGAVPFETLKATVEEALK